MMQITKHQGTHTTCFSKTCVAVMDFFLQNVTLYFTPTTVALCMERSLATIKDCMNILRKNSYLSKISDDGTVYYVTKENMILWHTDFKKHVLHLEELKQQR